VSDRHHPHSLKKPAENKVKNSGMFLDAEKRPSTHHELPAIHHNFTTKTPQRNTVFSQNPLQKRPSTTPQKNAARQTPDRIFH